MRRQGERTITVGPTTFIGPPFERCRNCGAEDGLGLLMVSSHAYFKRCRTCLCERRFDLPPAPTPRVLYLDQWAISLLAKALLPDHRDKFTSDDPITQRGAWPRLFARIERLVKLGLLVCPPSSIHQAESKLDDRLAGSLHRLHLHLAGGARFIHHAQVKAEQLYLAFCAWLDGTPVVALDRDDVIDGGGRWRDRFEVEVALSIEPAEIEALRRSRAEAVPPLEQFVGCWRAEGPRRFADRYAEQLSGFGPTLSPRPLSHSWSLLRSALKDRGVAAEDWSDRIAEFLGSEDIKQIPFARLGCGLFAALGWQVGRGQGVRVDRGLREDFQAIAVYAPFCDAMLVDRTCRRLLLESPLRSELPGDLRLFDVRGLGDLEPWLGDVEAGAPDGHLELVQGVYGEDWLKPYSTILE